MSNDLYLIKDYLSFFKKQNKTNTLNVIYNHLFWDGGFKSLAKFVLSKGCSVRLTDSSNMKEFQSSGIRLFLVGWGQVIS